jgi:hypothetical protein
VPRRTSVTSGPCRSIGEATDPIQSIESNRVLLRLFTSIMMPTVGSEATGGRQLRSRSSDTRWRHLEAAFHDMQVCALRPPLDWLRCKGSSTLTIVAMITPMRETALTRDLASYRPGPLDRPRRRAGERSRLQTLDLVFSLHPGTINVAGEPPERSGPTEPSPTSTTVISRLTHLSALASETGSPLNRGQKPRR